jgi:Putative abortive phage resistance protein AbiGi, antitoxin
MTNPSYVSDELTHFLGRSLPDHRSRYALLREILRTGWLKASHRDQLGPGFVGQSDGGKALSGNDAIKCTSVCFCDIPVTTLGIHMKKYSPFGVAFDKRIMLYSGATPVHYVARNARHRGVGIGPRTVGDWFDRLRKEIQNFANELGTYAASHDGPPQFLSKLSSPDTPHGHRLMGQFSALQNDLEFLVFGQLKFFTVGLAGDDPSNFYMEREWRVPEGFAFRLDDIARVIVPREFADQLRSDMPDYSGPITIAEEA